MCAPVPLWTWPTPTWPTWGPGSRLSAVNDIGRVWILGLPSKKNSGMQGTQTWIIHSARRCRFVSRDFRDFRDSASFWVLQVLSALTL